jgi:hypothetical protein
MTTFWTQFWSDESGARPDRIHPHAGLRGAGFGDLLTGQDLNGPGTGVAVGASVSSSDGAAGCSGTTCSLLNFNPQFALQRPAIVQVLDGLTTEIYIGFGVNNASETHYQGNPYHGWLIGYNPGQSLPSFQFVTTPTTQDSGSEYNERRPGIRRMEREDENRRDDYWNDRELHSSDLKIDDNRLEARCRTNTMRRSLLIFTLLSVPCWPQPAAQQPAQPPIVAKVEMPPTNPWVHLVELVVPGIIGAGLALFGVWVTNKRNAAENAANRENQLRLEIAKDKIAAEAKSRDNRWAFRKDVYSGLIRTICNILMDYNEGLAINRVYLEHFNDPQVMADFAHELKDRNPRTRAAANDFFIYSNLSPLAMASWVVEKITEVVPVVNPQSDGDLTSPDYAQTVAVEMKALNSLLNLICEAGRKDLWDTPEAEAKTEAATRPES